jgi:carbamoyl-phosphate synthase large subunit
LEKYIVTEKIVVMVTAIGGGGHGEQIVKALRLAGRYQIVGGDLNPYCPQFGDVDEAVTLPAASDPAFIAAVLSVAQKFGARAVFHGCEPELKAYSLHRDRFEAAGILLPINPQEVLDTCFDKALTGAFLRKNGFDAPRGLELTTDADVGQVEWYPVVVKPVRSSGGSKDCFIAQDRRELELLMAYLLIGQPGASVMVQEYCGTPNDEFTVGVLHDMDGRLINSIALRRELKSQLNIRSSARNRTNRAELGPSLVISSGISHGFVDRFPDVCGPCERIAAALGARGAINIQCRFVDGQVKVFEINPRFSGTTSIRAMMGYNEPDILLRRHLLNEPIEPRFSYRSGRVLRSLVEREVPDSPALDWLEVG